MIYGYARVSTRKQEMTGNSLEDQKEKLEVAGAQQIFSEAASGTNMNRPQFAKLSRIIKGGDTLMVTKLDRFARTTAEGIEVIQGFLDKGVGVYVLNMGMVDNTPTGKLILRIMLSFAEFERDMIVERTTTGKAVARKMKKSYHEGRPFKAIPDFDRYYTMVQNDEMTIVQACDELNITRPTWYKRAKLRHIDDARKEELRIAREERKAERQAAKAMKEAEV